MKICPTGTKPGFLYGQAKVHKPVEDNCQFFHPILSPVGTSTYELAKFLVSSLKPLTENEFLVPILKPLTVHDSFSFVIEVI